MNEIADQTGLQPTRKRRLADEIYSQIFGQLSRRSYGIGDRLPSENELSEALHVSRPVVREALTRLQDDGLLLARRGAGTFVVRLPPPEASGLDPDGTAAEYIRTYEVRQALETETARFAARRLTPETERELAQALKALHHAIFEVGVSIEEDLHFHLCIARATRNSLFVDQLVYFQRALLGSMSVTEQVTRNRSQQHMVYGEHAEIFEAIRSRDENLAVVMMANHLARVKMRMIDAGG